MKGIKIKSIRELRWEYCDILYLESIDFDIKKFTSDINFDYQVNANEELVEIFFHTRYGFLLKEKEDKVQILHSDIELEFHIEDFKENFEKLDKKHQLEIIALLLGITISTARGIIHSNTKGHLINKLILPIINPTSLLKKKLDKEKN